MAKNPIILDAIDTVFRQARILIPVVVLLTVIAAAYAMMKPRAYRSEAALLVRNERAQAVISPSEGGGSVVGPVTENEIRTEVELLQSRDLLLQAAANAGLTGPERGAAHMEQTLSAVRRSLRVNPMIKADMIRLEYTASSPEQGHRFLKSLLASYQDRHISLRGRSEVNLFRDEAQRLGTELRKKEQELSEFQRRTELHSLPEQKSMWLRRLMDSESALRDAELRQAESRQRSVSIANLVEGMPPRMSTLKRRLPNQYSVERLRTMLVELENKRIELLAKYRDDDRLVKQVAEQIAVTRQALAEAASGAVEEEVTDLNPHRQGLEGELYRSRVDASAAASRLQVLRHQVESSRGELARLETLSAEHDALNRQVRELGDRYQLHARKSEEARINAALDDRRVTNVVVAQEPNLPVSAESRPYLAAAGLWLIGCMLTFAGAIAFSSIRQVFHTPRDLESFTGVPVLGTVPAQAQQQQQGRG